MNIVEVLLKITLLGSSWVLYLLLVLSVVSFGVMFERFLFFRRNRQLGVSLREAVLDALKTNDEAQIEAVLRNSPTVQGQVLAAAFAFRDGGPGALGDALEAELAHAGKQLDRGMNFLGTIGNNAPFIGLLGTVIGVIVAFKELGTAQGNQAAMGNVMTGIAEALVATGVGLFVALPAVIAFNVATKVATDVEREAQALGHLIAAWLEIRVRGGVIRSRDGDVVTVAPGPTVVPAPLPSTARAK